MTVPANWLGLFERSAAQGCLAALLDRLSRGAGGAVFLVGGPGLGKTSLLRLTQASAGPDMTVRTGRGQAMEADLPFGLATQLLEPLGGAPLSEPWGLSAPVDARTSVWIRAQMWVKSAARERPLLFLIDDLHWSDPDSLELLAFLARRLSALGVGIVATMREWPTDAVDIARRLDFEQFAEVVPLEPLSRAGTEAMLQGLLGVQATAQAKQRAWALSGGNPLLLEHLASTVRTEGSLPEPADFDLGRFRNVLLLSSFGSLHEAPVGYAAAAAVLGPEFRIAVVPSVAELAVEEVGAALDVLIRCGLLFETRPGWASFTHPLVARAVYEDLAPGRRCQLHRRAYLRLSELGEIGAAARHAVCADLVGDSDAISTVRAAARLSLTSGAVLTALQQLDAAVGLCGGSVPGSLRLQLTEAFLAAARPVAAARECRDALQDVDLTGSERDVGMRLLTRALAYSGDLTAAVRAGGEAVSRTRVGTTEEPSREALSAAIVEHVHAVWQAHGPRPAWELLSTSWPGPVHEGTRPLRAASCFVAYFACADANTFEELTELLPQGGTPLSAEDQASPFDPMLTYLTVAKLVERYDEHDRILESAHALAVASGLVHARVALMICQFDGQLRRGRLLQAESILDQIERDTDIAPLMSEVLALARVALLCELGRVADAATVLSTTSPDPYMWMSRLSRAHLQGRVLLETHRGSEASEAYLRTEELADSLGVAEPCQVPWAWPAMESHLLAGRPRDAERICAQLESLLPRHPASWLRLAALAGRAALAAHAGDTETAQARYADATAVVTPLPLDRARALLAQGSFLRRANQSLSARTPLAEALALAERSGARLLSARAAEELRSAGGRRRGERPRAMLTAQQARVAELARQGCTTREMAQRLSLSVKTVDAHLTQVYRRLGITSKRELQLHDLDV